MADKSKLRARRGVRTTKSKWFLTGTAVLLGIFLIPGVFVSFRSFPGEEDHFNLRNGSPAGTTKPLFLNRPPRTPVIINIGSNVGPIVPDVSRDDPCMVSIAFEPIVPEKIAPHPALHVVPAAVTGTSSDTLAVMHVYNKYNAVSSSLATAAYEASWNSNEDSIKLVPTIEFQSVLDSLADYDIHFLLTDMQGYDFSAVSSVGDALKRIPRLQTEVYTHNTVTYQDVHNDLCRDWWPHMVELGYVLDALFGMDGTRLTEEGYRSHEEVAATCRAQMEADAAPVNGLKEADAIWRRADVAAGDDPVANARYPIHKPRRHGPQLSAEQYRACHKRE